jgi:ribosomal protein S18 acetylase RimI-like enzyme
MNTELLVNNNPTTILRTPSLRIIAAELGDCDVVVAMFGALHRYNASLDAHFALSPNWELLLRQEFCISYCQSDKLWLLVKDGEKTVGLLIAGIHTDSLLFQHRQWVEIEALYVAPSHRCMGLAHTLLDKAYDWAQANGLARVQLYVTATNEHAQAVYTEQGFSVTQAIMRKSLA